MLYIIRLFFRKVLYSRWILSCIMYGNIKNSVTFFNLGYLISRPTRITCGNSKIINNIFTRYQDRNH